MSFLNLDHAPADGLPWQTIQCQLDSDVRICCQGRGWEVPAFYQQAWAIVLSRYISSTGVTFAIGDDKTTNTLPSTCEVAVEPEFTINDLVTNTFRSTVFTSSPADTSSNNTGVGYEISDVEALRTSTLQVVLSISTSGAYLLHSPGISSWHAKNIVSAVEMVIYQMIKYPTRAIKDIDMFNEENRNQVLQWHKRPRKNASLTLVDAIKQHASQQPTRQALSAWDGELTYAELDQVTSRLAHHFRSIGIKENDFVLVGFEKSIFSIISIIAIHKAGAAFVPVSPHFPTARLQIIADITKASLALTSPEFVSAFNGLNAPVLGLTSSLIENLPELEQVSDELPETDIQRYAYVIFTSGSTGRPKGVLHTHRSLSSLVNQDSGFQIHSNSRVLQVAPYVFAASVMDMVLPLLIGATICIASQHDLMNSLEASLVHYKVSWAIMTPSASRSINPDLVSQLETLCLVGEPLDKATFKKWSGKVGLLSGFGLSEGTGGACVTMLDPSKHPQNIGHSPSGRLWLADPLNIEKPASMGSIAELLFDGENVAYGYLDEPVKTAAMFIQPPEWVAKFSPDSHAPTRMMRTGDLVRYLEDGSVVYIGRKDTQVKIRGKRVELGEVESTIRLHRPPGEAVIVEAISPADMPDTATLVCFIHSAASVLESTSLLGEPSPLFTTETQTLDTLIRATLPDYMVPTIYIPLNHIPKTPSGKTDRRAIKIHVSALNWHELEIYVHGNDKPRVEPQTDIQKTLHSLFSEVLNRKPELFGIHDSFVKLGGDSIQAIQFVQLCRNNGLSISVKDILESGTIAELADLATNEPDTQFEKTPRELIPQSAVLQELSKVGILADQVEEIDLCSAMQEGILMSQLKSPHQHALRVVYEVRLANGDTTLELGRLEAAWKELAQRHPMLRSIFATNVTPQVFAAQVQLKTESQPRVYQLAEEVEPAAILKQRHSTQLPSTLPQLSFHVAPTGRVLVELEFSHAVTDGMSMAIIVRDLCSLYNQKSLSPLNFKYADYMNYKKQSLNEKALSYWKEYLGGMDSCQFPTAKADATGSSDSHDEDEFKAIMIDVGSAVDYHKFARDNDTTLSSMIKLAWHILLRVTTRTDDVCFGYLIAGRDAPVDGAIDGVGPLIDLMICRQRFEPGAVVSDLLRSIHSEFLEGLPHRGASFADIRRALNFSRDEVMFNTCVSQYPLSAMADKENSDMSLTEVARHDPNEFDLGLEVLVSDHDITSRLKAYTSVVPVQQMERVGALFGHIMKSIVGGFNKRIDDLDLISDADRSVIKSLNNRLPESVDRCAHDIIQDQCVANPSAPAVNAWDGNWTYKEFDEISSSISKFLTAQGVTSDTFVPVLMDKSRWVPVSLFGILKAGAAFVLLEPTQPIQRLQEICGDLNPSAIIAAPAYQMTAASLVSKVLVLDNELPVPQAEVLEEKATTVSPRNLAYAVFTSGSTGKPKGVMVEHHSLCTTGTSMRFHSPMDNNMRMYQYASFAFDVSVLDLIVCFMAGGCLCIPSFEDRQNRLLESLNEFQANYVALTPTVTRTLQPERLTSLKTLKVSGEALTASDIQRWGGAPGIQFINMYGPAECTINVTVQAPVTLASPPLAIGYSMSNSTAWVVDPNNHERLCPVGAVGELVIQGPVVARGYLNRPEQTAASFIAPPHWLSTFMSVSSDEKLYKTGDLVQYALDGTFLYKGRKDSQVKLRGQRLELGEVEEHLRRVFPDASEVIAEVASLNQGKTKALAAFVCQKNWGNETSVPPSSEALGEGSDLLHPACDGFSRAVAEARVGLASSLPSYMEPTIYLPLLHIPQTRSGKTDRGQLRRMLSAGLHEKWAGASQTTISRQAPSNEAESVLCQSVAEALGLKEEDVSMNDNFFRRGGDSVAAMMLVSMLRQKGFHITVANIFEQPRLDYLAGMMHSDLSKNVSDVPPPFALLGPDSVYRDAAIKQAVDQCGVSVDEIEDIYPCSPLQHAFFLFSRSRGKGTLVAQTAFDLRPTIDLDLLREAWAKTTQAHPQLRSRIISLEGKDVMHQAVLRQSVEVEYHEPPSEDVTDFIPDMGLDVATGKPLFRVAIVRRPSSDQHRLIISLQHSIYDGWSLSLMVQELERAYAGLTLDYLPVSSFIRHLHQTRDADKAFWTEELKDLYAPNFPPVPPTNYTPHPSAVLIRKVAIPKNAPGQITVSTKVRWAWAQVISNYTGSSEVAFGMGTAGRGTPVASIEKMVTPALGIFPYRLFINSEESVVEALQKAQQHYIQLLPHEHYGNPNISRLATGPTSAVGLQTLLVVQPQDAKFDSAIWSAKELLPQTGAFHVRALSLHCHLEEDAVEVYACYDEDVLSEKDMSNVVSLFEAIFQQICGEPDIPVKDLKGLSV